jgi:hypothetical protein
MIWTSGAHSSQTKTVPNPVAKRISFVRQYRYFTEPGSLQITEGAGFSDSDEAGGPHPTLLFQFPPQVCGWLLSLRSSEWTLMGACDCERLVSALRLALFRFFRIAM